MEKTNKHLWKKTFEKVFEKKNSLEKKSLSKEKP